MALDSIVRRRWVGGLALAGALAMLVGGETFLKGHLQPVAFLVYWLICFLFTGLAIVIAFLDARALQHRIRREQRDLFEATLRQIQREAKGKAPNNGRPPTEIRKT